ncbi:MAG: hypothetical protein V1674_04515 [Candidatus Omnitrophota bacterium]
MINLKTQKGTLLIIGYAVVAVLIIVGAGFLMVAVSENRSAQMKRMQSQAYYLAEGGLEDAIFQFTQALSNYQTPPTTGSTASMNSTFTITPIGNQYVQANPEGTQSLVQNYRITVSAIHPENASVNVTINQVIARKLTPVFQFAVFYDPDLEILPGAQMLPLGRIHCNSNIYLGAEAGVTLTLDSEYVHAVGDMYRSRKDSPRSMNGTVDIKVAGSSPTEFEPMTLSPLFDSTDPNWTDGSQTLWNGTVKSGVHGVTKIVPPEIASTEPNGFFDNNADLKIKDNRAYTNAGIDITGSLPVNTITEKTLYNNRELKWVKVTEIDVAKVNTSGYFPNNGLLYATRSDATMGNPNGIRLTNGSTLADGLTLVTNDPVYIKGDYNNTNKKPASIICDSLNLLSNNWSDANSNKSLANRVALNTTINSAFISGSYQTQTGVYNGGVENYPRFLENWTNKTLNMKMSFVNIWDSSLTTGFWQYGDPQYTAPIRNWMYDTDFDDVNKLPPFCPRVIEIVRIARW